MGLGLNPNQAFPRIIGELSEPFRNYANLPEMQSHTDETKKTRVFTGVIGSVRIGLKIRCPQGRVGSSPSSGTPREQWQIGRSHRP